MTRSLSEIEIAARADGPLREAPRRPHNRPRDHFAATICPTALIEARIAAKLTQRQLAKRIGVAEQQIQRWEANGYSGVNLTRLQEHRRRPRRADARHDYLQQRGLRAAAGS